MIDDKEIERKRFDSRAKLALSGNTIDSAGPIALDSVPVALNAPYRCFETAIRKYTLTKNCAILEIGSGSGLHTASLLATGAFVTATDISEASLKLLQKRFENAENLETRVADMESLPFGDNSFDVIVCAGSLSYGDNETVMGEVYRTLRGGGVFIAVDSLNHNPIYQLNRWVHYLRGDRTVSTLKRMPTVSLIKSYGLTFGNVEAHYFGTISWLVPVLRKLFGENRVASISNAVDSLVNVRKSAFKFVMVVTKELK